MNIHYLGLRVFGCFLAACVLGWATILASGVSVSARRSALIWGLIGAALLVCATARADGYHVNGPVGELVGANMAGALMDGSVMVPVVWDNESGAAVQVDATTLDIYAYTQKPENVDKMFRSFTQEFIYLTNVGKKKFGFFQAPKFFRMAAYPDVFTGAPGQVSEWSRSFRMDFRLADCYETAKGIGIEAQKADKESPARGISWRWALLLPVLLAAAFPLYGLASKHLVHRVLGGPVAALSAARGGTNHLDAVSGGRLSVDSSSTGAVGAGVAAALPGEKQNLMGRPLPSAPKLDARTVAQAVFAASESVPTVSHDVFFVGVMTTPDSNGRLVTTVVLSDRTVYVLGVDKELTSVTAKYCIVGGVMYAWRSYTDMAREAGASSSYPAFTKSGVVPTPPAAVRSGGVIVGGSPRQY